MPSGGEQTSLAGSWGAEKLRNLQGSKDRIRKEFFTTEFSKQFSDPPLELIRERERSPMNRHAEMRKSGFSLTSLRSPEDPVAQSRPPSSNGNSRPTTSSSSFSNSGLPRREATAAFPRSVHKDSFVDFSMSRDEQIARETFNLSHSNSRLLRSADAPRAVGRSGHRRERGCATSGLSGERLNTSSEPHYNSFAQRAWVYSDDPALHIRSHGRPKPTPVRDLSLILPAEYYDIAEEAKLENDLRQHNEARASTPVVQMQNESQRTELQVQEQRGSQAHFGRRYVYTGDVLSKTGARRYGVFLDEHDKEVMQDCGQTKRR